MVGLSAGAHTFLGTRRVFTVSRERKIVAVPRVRSRVSLSVRGVCPSIVTPAKLATFLACCVRVEPSERSDGRPLDR